MKGIHVDEKTRDTQKKPNPDSIKKDNISDEAK